MHRFGSDTCHEQSKRRQEKADRRYGHTREACHFHSGRFGDRLCVEIRKTDRAEAGKDYVYYDIGNIAESHGIGKDSGSNAE